MGQYYQCRICGQEEKGMLPDCGCEEKITYKNIEDALKLRLNSCIVEAETVKDSFGVNLYEKLKTRNGEYIYTCTSLYVNDQQGPGIPIQGIWIIGEDVYNNRHEDIEQDDNNDDSE